MIVRMCHMHHCPFVMSVVLENRDISGSQDDEMWLEFHVQKYVVL